MPDTALPDALLPDTLLIAEDDLSSDETRALVALHIAAMLANSPPEKVHALPIDALRQPGVTFFTARIGGVVAGMGAIKDLAPGHAELKSMRVAPDFLGRGVGEAILRHLLAIARERGNTRVSLETGRGEAFVPALALYGKYGFEPCPAFADYVLDGFSQCLTRELS